MSPKHSCRRASLQAGCGNSVVRLVAWIALWPLIVIAYAHDHSLSISGGRNALNETPSKIEDVSKDSQHSLIQGKTEDQFPVPLKDSGILLPQARREKATMVLQQAREDKVSRIVLQENANQPPEDRKPKKSTFIIQTMRDQIDSAKKYLNFLRINSNHRLLRELKSHIRENELILRGSHVDGDLPKSAPEKIKALDQILIKARDQRSKCEALVKKLRALLLVNEEKIQILKDEGKFLGRLASRTMPRGLHCLALQLTIKYYSQPNKSMSPANRTKLEDPQLYHYAIFSENILAASVVVNSTVFHVKDSHNHVFHILTNSLNYVAMKTWFLTNTPSGAIVEVRNLDAIRSSTFSKMAKRYLQPVLSKPSDKYQEMRQKCLENFGLIDRLQLYLPDMFPNLDKILLLADDIVVRTDMTGLWRENLEGKVSGAVTSCQTNSYHSDNFSHLSPEVIFNRVDLSAWASRYCIHIFDLKEVKQRNITNNYVSLSPLKQAESGVENLPRGLIAGDNNTHTLDKFWNILHLDGISDAKQDEFPGAAAIHYGGYVKPWLEMNGRRYKAFWTRFVNYENPLLQECNINK